MTKKKTLKRIITFSTTTDAMAFERHCLDHDIPGRLIPVPGQISAGCGMCWMVKEEDAGPSLKLAEKGIMKTEGIYWITL